MIETRDGTVGRSILFVHRIIFLSNKDVERVQQGVKRSNTHARIRASLLALVSVNAWIKRARHARQQARRVSIKLYANIQMSAISFHHCIARQPTGNPFDSSIVESPHDRPAVSACFRDFWWVDRMDLTMRSNYPRHLEPLAIVSAFLRTMVRTDRG